jgi:hypothetical protein
VFEAFAPRLEFGRKQLADIAIARNGRAGRFRHSVILAGHCLLQPRQCLRQRIIVFGLHLDFSSLPFLNAALGSHAHISSCLYTSTV